MQVWLVCVPGREAAVQADPALREAAPTVLAPGWLSAQLLENTEPVLPFVSQVLPAPQALQASSVRLWATQIVAALQQQDSGQQETFCLQVFCHNVRGAALRPSRAQLIAQTTLDLLKRQDRKLFRRIVIHSGDADPTGAAPADPAAVAAATWVKVGMLDAENGSISFATPTQRVALRHVISAYPGGLVPLEEDKAPPSRAYRKLLEAQALLGVRMGPGHRCIDLGAAPGSWSYVALQQGACVLALDRSPLRDDLMAQPRLTFCTGNAFTFVPPASNQLTWLLCDVIAFPERSLQLLRTWLEKKYCDLFVVTLKFRGPVEHALLQECTQLLRTHCDDFMLRCLENNKNEVTALGRPRGGRVP
jgi:23S rRNA (cytidine2498-2'-O)-methyltransferase